METCIWAFIIQTFAEYPNIHISDAITGSCYKLANDQIITHWPYVAQPYTWL